MGDSTFGGLFPSGIGNQFGGPSVTGSPGIDPSATGTSVAPTGGLPSGVSLPPNTGDLVLPSISPTGSSSSGVGNILSNISLPQLASGAGMLTSLIKGPGTVPQKGNIESIAGSEAAQGQQLLPSLATGQLPPGEDSLVNQQLQAQIAAIQQKYAQMGLSGSTMEQQDIANANAQAVAQRANLAQQATSEGLSLLSAADTAYGNLGQQQVALDNQLSQSLADMMQAFGGGTGTQKDKNQQAVGL